jgi:hypothetical protein
VTQNLRGFRQFPAFLRWMDGVHLDERSSLLIARQIDQFLKGLDGGR